MCTATVAWVFVFKMMIKVTEEIALQRTKCNSFLS